MPTRAQPIITQLKPTTYTQYAMQSKSLPKQVFVISFLQINPASILLSEYALCELNISTDYWIKSRCVYTLNNQYINQGLLQ